MEVRKLVTKRGFIEAFWARLKERRATEPTATHRSVYEELSDIYEKEFGEQRFPSFDAFRKCRDRIYRNRG